MDAKPTKTRLQRWKTPLAITIVAVVAMALGAFIGYNICYGAFVKGLNCYEWNTLMTWANNTGNYTLYNTTDGYLRVARDPNSTAYSDVLKKGWDPKNQTFDSNRSMMSFDLTMPQPEAPHVYEWNVPGTDREVWFAY